MTIGGYTRGPCPPGGWEVPQLIEGSKSYQPEIKRRMQARLDDDVAICPRATHHGAPKMTLPPPGPNFLYLPIMRNCFQNFFPLRFHGPPQTYNRQSPIGRDTYFRYIPLLPISLSRAFTVDRKKAIGCWRPKHYQRCITIEYNTLIYCAS